jgi:hypothetical protein
VPTRRMSVFAPMIVADCRQRESDAVGEQEHDRRCGAVKGNALGAIAAFGLHFWQSPQPW